MFDEEARDILLESDPNEITTTTRRLLHQRGQSMTYDAGEKFKQGIISERVYKLIIAGTKDAMK